MLYTLNANAFRNDLYTINIIVHLFIVYRSEIWSGWGVSGSPLSQKDKNIWTNIYRRWSAKQVNTNRNISCFLDLPDKQRLSFRVVFLSFQFDTNWLCCVLYGRGSFNFPSVLEKAIRLFRFRADWSLCWFSAVALCTSNLSWKVGKMLKVVNDAQTIMMHLMHSFI